ncbi:MAG: hypothetical protein CMI09_13490 [Oceanospirillaceae bacterium]|nr:hypothetical protein [Oceanospirillaceae bacterium]|tara:strand:+ start:320 stop:955 length:636 start_codon:yes stop_codon:yes gene_type:complete
MNSLVWNVEISQRLRISIQLALGALPIGLMFAAFIPLFLIAEILAGALGIPDGAPVIEQANGITWLILFLVIMVGLMVAGYLIGWFLNALIFKLIYRWPDSKLKRVFLNSEIPEHWLKAGDTVVDTTSSSNSAWANTRKKGKFKFILIHGVLAWGAPMFFLMSVFPVFNGNRAASFSYFGLQLCIWVIAGAAFGSFIWYSSEKSFKKNENS